MLKERRRAFAKRLERLASHVFADAEGHAEVADVEESAVVAGKFAHLSLEFGSGTEIGRPVATLALKAMDAIRHTLDELFVGQYANAIEAHLIGCHFVSRRVGSIEFQLHVETANGCVDTIAVGQQRGDGIDEGCHEPTGIRGMYRPELLHVFFELPLRIGAVGNYLGTEDVTPRLVFLGRVVELKGNSTFVYRHGVI